MVSYGYGWVRVSYRLGWVMVILELATDRVNVSTGLGLGLG